MIRVLMVRESVSSVSCDSSDSDEIHQRERKKEREKVCVCLCFRMTRVSLVLRMIRVLMVREC